METMTVRENPAGGSPLLPPCRVCGEKASGFHYGANTCEGCKVFFRRSLKRQVQYKCIGNGKCMSTTGSRNSCQYCRFGRCKEVGMSRSAIRHGRYTHSVRTQNILEVKSLISDGSKPPPTFGTHISSPGGKRPSDGLDLSLSPGVVKRERLDSYGKSSESSIATIGEKGAWLFGVTPTLDGEQKSAIGLLGEQVMKALGPFDHSGDFEEFVQSDSVAYVGRHGSLGRVTAETILRELEPTSKTLDNESTHSLLDRWFKGLEEGVVDYVKACKQLPGFTDLPLSDQASMIKWSRNEVWVLSLYRGFVLEHGLFCTQYRRTYRITEFFAHWDRELVGLLLRLVQRLQALELTRLERSILTCLCVFAPDRCEQDLQRADHLGLLHTEYLRALQYLIEQRRPHDAMAFPRMIQVLSDVRTYSARAQEFLSSIKVQWPQVLPPPIVAEVFLAPP